MKQSLTKMVNVPSPAIHIENDISLLQKKLWFELVYHAFPKMGTQRRYKISLSLLREMIGWSESTSSDSKLKEALHGLNKTAIEWNIFGKDKKRTWQSFPLLAGCEIPENSGICIFEFSSFLEERFLAMGKEAYVKIDLIISKKFQSKYALSIYCLALDYLVLESGYSEKTLSLEALRKYLGIKDNEYKLTADMNRWVIKQSEKEINSTSDMNIEIKPIKESRRISGYKLCMSLKEGRVKEYLDKKNRLQEINNESNFDPISNIKTKPVKATEPKNLIKITNEKLRTFYAENNISMTTKTVQDKLVELKETFQDHFENYLLFLMNYTKREDKRTTITNLSGFYIGLIKDDSQMENYLLQYQKHKEQEQNTLTKINKLIEIELENKYESFLVNDFEVYINKNIKKLENKIVEILKNNIKPGEFFYAILQRNNSGVIDISLITEAKESTKMTCLGYLKKHEKELNYKKLSFDEWKTKNVTEKDIEALREGISKSLKNP